MSIIKKYEDWINDTDEPLDPAMLEEWIDEDEQIQYRTIADSVYFILREPTSKKQMIKSLYEYMDQLTGNKVIEGSSSGIGGSSL